MMVPISNHEMNKLLRCKGALKQLVDILQVHRSPEMDPKLRDALERAVIALNDKETEDDR